MGREVDKGRGRAGNVSHVVWSAFGLMFVLTCVLLVDFATFALSPIRSFVEHTHTHAETHPLKHTRTHTQRLANIEKKNMY